MHKTHQGGIGARSTNKSVYVYGASNIERCPVCIFKKCCRLLPPPKSCKKMYLRPKSKIEPNVWFCDQPYENNKVASTVKDICKEAGFQGKFTNHSLCATSASRMYNANVPEQIIKEVTGHRSECVRIYKRTSDDIRQKASETISGKSNDKIEFEKSEKPQCTESYDSGEQESLDQLISEEDKKKLVQSLSACQMIKNVIRSRMEIRKKVNRHGNLVKQNCTEIG